jgi:hypothetical protein
MLFLAHARPWLLVAGIVVGITVVLFLIERVFSWLGKNAGKYMRNDNAVTGGMRNVMGSMEEFVHPEIRHVHEEQEQRQAESGQTDPSER